MRRALVVSIVVAAISFASNVRAEDFDVEASAYGGVRPRIADMASTTHDHRANYAGFGADFVHLPLEGFVARAGASIERRTYCTWSGSCPWWRGQGAFVDHWVDGTAVGTTEFPTSAAEYGFHARIGWTVRVFGIEAGVAAASETIYRTDPGRTWRVVPDIVLRIGDRRGWFMFGYGVYDVVTMQTPGVYLRGRLPIGAQSGALLAVGVAGDGFGNFIRVDGAFEHMLGDVVRIGAGVGWLEAESDQQHDTGFGFDARVFGGAAF
jgi:hypothetical protein